MAESQFIEHVPLGIVAEPFARHFFQNGLQRDEIEAAVLLLCLGPEMPLGTRRNEAYEGIRAIGAEFVQIVLRALEIGREARGMRKEVLHGDVYLLTGLRVFPGQEIGDVLAHGINQPYLPALHQLHEGKGGSHALGDGG